MESGLRKLTCQSWQDALGKQDLIGEVGHNEAFEAWEGICHDIHPVEEDDRLTERDAISQGLIEFTTHSAESLGLLRRPNQVHRTKSFSQTAPNFVHSLVAGTRDNIMKLRNIKLSNLPKIRSPPPTPVMPAGRWVPR